MSRHDEDRQMDDVASVGSMQGRKEHTAATVLLLARIEQASQSVQQTAAAVGQALQHASRVQAQTQELCIQVEGALRQQAATAQTQAGQ